jgi:hypothetical protein
MYKCDACGNSTAPGEGIRRVVTNVRFRTYPVRTYKHKGDTVTDPGGHGSEIINEAKVCRGCEFKMWGNEGAPS